MLFSRERTIIFINREKIRWAKGHVPSGKFLSAVKEATCSEENLQLALADIVENFPNKTRIVMGEEFSYVTRFQKHGGKEQILNEAQALIPEKLEEGWDSKDGDADSIQIMAIQQQVFAVLKRMLLENKIKAEAIEAESVSIVRTILSEMEKDKVVLLVRYDGKILLEAVKNGTILATRVLFQFPSKEKIQEFLDYLYSRKKISIDRTYVRDETGELAKILLDLGLNIQERPLDPMTGICLKKDIMGRDQEILNIILNQREVKKRKG